MLYLSAQKSLTSHNRTHRSYVFLLWCIYRSSSTQRYSLFIIVGVVYHTATAPGIVTWATAYQWRGITTDYPMMAECFARVP